MQLTVNDPSIMTNVETIPKREADRIAIIGCSASRAEAPWNEPGWEFWGVNNLIAHELDKPWTRWFEIHFLHKDEIGQWMRRYQYDFRGQKCPDYVAMLSGVKNGRTKQSIPVYMQRKWPEIPNSEIFPFKTLLSNFRPYFTNTISWQMAMAVAMLMQEPRAKEPVIGVWGVDMATMESAPGPDGFRQGEYCHQRPSCEWLVGLCEGLGIKVIIPETSDLMKTRFQYALEEPRRHAWEKKRVAWKNEMIQRENADRQRMMALEHEKEAILARLNQYKGARMGIDAVKLTWHHEAMPQIVDELLGPTAPAQQAQPQAAPPPPEEAKKCEC